MNNNLINAHCDACVYLVWLPVVVLAFCNIVFTSALNGIYEITIIIIYNVILTFGICMYIIYSYIYGTAQM